MPEIVLEKKELMNLFSELPENILLEDIMERLFIISKIKKGCQEADKGKTLSHIEVEKRLEKWLK